MKKLYNQFLDHLLGEKCLNGTRGCWGRCAGCIKVRIEREKRDREEYPPAPIAEKPMAVPFKVGTTRQEFRVWFNWTAKGGALNESHWGPYPSLEKASEEALLCAQQKHRSNIRVECRNVIETGWGPIPRT